MPPTMPVTTVFEIGEGRFTVILYPESSTSSSGALATATPTTTPSAGSGLGASSSSRQTTRTATKSLEANIHQVSTSLSPTPTDQSQYYDPMISSYVFPYVSEANSTGVWGETTTVLDDGVTWTASPDVITWTSGSGVYTSEVWELVPEQGSEGSETGVKGMNKR